MASSFDELLASGEVRAAHNVAYSLHMLAEITTEYDRTVDDGQFLAARCMVDTFYVHLRLIADFLVKRPKGDIGPAHFGVRWSTPDCAEVGRLASYHDDASKYVVHFGRRRIPEDLGDLNAFKIGRPHWGERLTDVVKVFDSFMQMLEELASEWGQGSLLPNPGLEPEAWGQRVRWEQAMILRCALDKARSACRLGTAARSGDSG